MQRFKSGHQDTGFLLLLRRADVTGGGQQREPTPVPSFLDVLPLFQKVKKRIKIVRNLNTRPLLLELALLLLLLSHFSRVRLCVTP